MYIFLAENPSNDIQKKLKMYIKIIILPEN